MMLGGRYEVQDTLFTRGAVRIVRALDTKEQQPVVIRAMPVSVDDMEMFVRFQEEGAVITSLDHPNIWKVYGTFIDQGMSCVVVEAVEGRTLGDLLRAGRLPLARARHIALQLASAMVYAHQRSIIHRNLEPENVVVTHGDVVKVRDMAELGMARLVRGAAVPMPTATARADLYASPEQRQGRTVGPLTDVYSLGALMYHMVNGHPPFDDTIYSAELPFRPDVPIEWQSMIARAMARNERYRIGSAVQLGRAIAALPAPGAPPARFEEAAAERCARCGREGRGNFCSSCGAPLGTGR